jgi:hypothetical protein
MNPLLKKVKDIYTEGCISIMMNTHRTKPDNQNDPVLLKNMVKEAEEKLLAQYDKKFALPIIEKVKKIADSVNHNFNLESLVIYASSDFADFTRLPVKVENRVMVDNTFATRDLVRSMHQESSYYVLVFSRQQARLIVAYNDTVVEENSQSFPLENDLYTTSKSKLSMKQGTDNLYEEFFNRVDKVLNEIIKNHPLPVILATETRNFEHYLKIADKKDMIIGHVNMNRDEEKAHHIVPEAWEIMQTLIRQKNEARIKDLKKAVSEGKFVSDLNDIRNAIFQGRGKTLFVKRGFFQPALLVDDQIIPVDHFEKDQKGVVDDIIDEMIEQTMAFGGDVVFVEGNDLDKFRNVALMTRY